MYKRQPLNVPDEIVNFDKRIPIEGEAFPAWGYLTYTRPLSEQDISAYELRPSRDNPRLPEVKTLPIAEQMAQAQKLAQEHQAPRDPGQSGREER